MRTDGRAATARQWSVWFVVFLAIGVLWSIATPRFASPDEPAHVRKAAGTVRLEGIGEQVPGQPEWLRTFDIPDAYTGPDPGCFAFDSTTSAACATLPPITGDEVPAASSASRYPPLYYVVAGAPSLVVTTYGGQYAVRVASAVLSAAALATALVLAGRSSYGRWPAVGALVAITPMVAFLTGVVNPNGAETTLFLAGWVALIVALEAHQAGRVPRWMPAAVLFGLGVLMRQLGVVWLAAGAVVVAVLLGWESLRAAIRSRPMQIAVGVVVGAVAVQFLWMAAVDSLGAVEDPRIAIGDEISDSTIVHDVINASMGNVREMIGRLGWYDVPVPSITELVWLVGVGGLVVAALVGATRRHALAVMAAVAFTWLIPVVLEIKDARATGYYWQGRYTLPLAVLVPIIAAWALGARLGGSMPGRLRALVAAGLVVGHVATFHQALRRYMVGLDGPLTLRDPEWRPPISAWLLIVAYAIAWAGACWLVLADRTARADA